jgi:ElaB/YqjD/DUF883 family membrane-anchored ribosome-binding protein
LILGRPCTLHSKRTPLGCTSCILSGSLRVSLGRGPTAYLGKSQPLKPMQNRLSAKTREALVQDVGTLKRDAVRVVQDVREHAHAHVDETRERVTDTVETVRQKLVANPLYLIGFGFGVGLLFGLRLGGAKRSE